MAEQNALAPIGKILNLQQNENRFLIDAENGHVEITVLSDQIIRQKIYSGSSFEDKTKGKILAISEKDLPTAFPAPHVSFSDEGSFYQIATENVSFRIFKDAFRLEAFQPNGKLYFKESAPLSLSAEQSVQTLEGAEKEYFYGCGVQNGYFSHKGRSVAAELKVSHWNAGSSSNPAPFYVSSNGYGEFRNTFCPGTYDFLDQTTLSQKEGQLDCFYFFGQSIPKVIDLYTQLTGRPHFIPRWGLLPGDANCYKETMDALKTAEGYVEHKIPRGWILPNDGYGCGYTDLKGFVQEAEKLHFHVGLWTENSMDKIKQEVSEFGSRAVKTDVAWVGPGYEFALDGVDLCHNGIEDNSDARSYLWTCCGWAGTQRYSTVWTGDQFGNWEYIRMHIPTYIGSGLSGNPYCGSDVDGIFAGSAETQVRDLQWKCFTPILIQMSGWAPKNKQAWVWGDPYESYNREYLTLKFRLTPYMYSHAYQSSLDATPIMRPLFWDFGDDKYLMNKDTQYEYLLGESFLVAPIFEDTDTRDAIYLPGKGQLWIDYMTGDQYEGNQVLNSFHAPLEKLPVFVKSGSIIPMYPAGLYDGDNFPDESHPLTLDIYPNGEQTFKLYEDDGYSKEYRNGNFAMTTITAKAPQNQAGTLSVTISAAEGSYKDMPESRMYELAIHTKVAPQSIKVGDNVVNLVSSKADFDSASGFCGFFDKDMVGGVLFVKTPAVSVRETVAVTVDTVDNCPVPVEVTDSDIPAVPTGLAATEITDNKIVLAWDAVPAAKWYDLLVDGLVFTHVSNPYTHRELDFTTDYTYQVRACNTKGHSDWSSPIVCTTLESSLKDALSGEDMTVSATSERPGYESHLAVNGDGESMWLSVQKDEPDLPCTYTMDFKNAYKINRFDYKSRPKGTRGNITKYNLSVSIDGIHYKTVVKEGTWDDQDEAHVVKFDEEVVQHIKIDALEGLKDSANAIHFIPYKAPGTDIVLPGNYTGGDGLDDNDLTFVRNYMGVFSEDNDWGYVSKCDINYNGMVDSYDLAFVASKLDGGLVAPEEYASGEITVSANVSSVKAGDTFEVEVNGHNLKNIYAFHAMINLDTSLMEHTNCMGKCKKEVIARSGEIVNDFVNASTVKADENGTKVVAAFSGKGNTPLIQGDGQLAVFTLKALKDMDSIPLDVISTMLVGGKLDIVGEPIPEPKKEEKKEDSSAE